MSAEQEQELQTSAPMLSIDVNPSPVDAGSRMTLTGTVIGAKGYDLRGQKLLIRDTDGDSLGEVAFEEYDGELNRTGGLELDAPSAPGEYQWLAVMTEDTGEGEPREAAQVPFGFEVKAHSTSIVVWDVPTAVETGATLNIKVGIKCSSACDASGAGFVIHDEDGAEIATGTVGEDIWPGTAGLHYAEVELTAPEAEGRYPMQVTAAMDEFDLAHAEGSARFRLNCTPPGEFTVAVTVVNAQDKTPVERARLQMHPYRGLADAEGRAEFRVAKGRYKIVASGKEFAASRVEIDVGSDMQQTIELVPEPTDDEKLWVWA